MEALGEPVGGSGGALGELWEAQKKKVLGELGEGLEELLESSGRLYI